MEPLEFIFETRPRYSDTDAMGIVYYSRYYEFFEAARTDMLRAFGLPYSKFEESGYSMPVTESHCKYIKGAQFDELLRVKCTIKQIPRARLKIYYQVNNSDGELIARGYTVHAFLDDQGNVRRAPQHFLEHLKSGKN
jgi:acyl-CoA thioester hydrolase